MIVSTDSGASSVLAGLRILVVEEEQAERRALKAALQRKGASVTAVAGVDDAVQMAERHRPHVLITGLQDDEARNADLVRRVRAVCSRSGYELTAVAIADPPNGSDDDDQHGSPFHARLTRPFATDDLVEAVRRCREYAQSAAEFETTARETRAVVKAQLEGLRTQRESLRRQSETLTDVNRALFSSASGVDARENVLLGRLLAFVRTDRVELETVQLRRDTRLAFPGDRLDCVLFPEGGVISVSSDLSTGQSVGCYNVGRTSALGVWLALGVSHTSFRASVLLEGRAVRLRRESLQQLLSESEPARRLLQDHCHAIYQRAMNMVACHSFHTIEQRLCTLLLELRAASGLSSFRLTHDTVAALLGVRRAGVTETLGALDEMGSVTCRRGHIEVLNTSLLEATTCECYSACRDLL